MARIAINGFGRIGRNILRAAIKRGARLDVVHINDIDKPKTLAHLFKFDSVHGIFEGKVEALEDAIVVNGKKIAVTAKRDPSELAHKEHKVDIALECSGRFTNRPDADGRPCRVPADRRAPRRKDLGHPPPGWGHRVSLHAPGPSP